MDYIEFYKEKKDEIHKLHKYFRFPESLTQCFSYYLTANKKFNYLWTDMQRKNFKIIPSIIKTEIILNSYQNYLKRIILFKFDVNATSEFLSIMKLAVFEQFDFVYRIGE